MGLLDRLTSSEFLSSPQTAMAMGLLAPTPHGSFGGGLMQGLQARSAAEESQLQQRLANLKIMEAQQAAEERKRQRELLSRQQTYVGQLGAPMVGPLQPDQPRPFVGGTGILADGTVTPEEQMGLLQFSNNPMAEMTNLRNSLPRPAALPEIVTLQNELDKTDDPSRQKALRGRINLLSSRAPTSTGGGSRSYVNMWKGSEAVPVLLGSPEFEEYLAQGYKPATLGKGVTQRDIEGVAYNVNPFGERLDGLGETGAQTRADARNELSKLRYQHSKEVFGQQITQQARTSERALGSEYNERAKPHTETMAALNTLDSLLSGDVSALDEAVITNQLSVLSDSNVRAMANLNVFKNPGDLGTRLAGSLSRFFTGNRTASQLEDARRLSKQLRDQVLEPTLNALSDSYREAAIDSQLNPDNVVIGSKQKKRVSGRKTAAEIQAEIDAIDKELAGE